MGVSEQRPLRGRRAGNSADVAPMPDADKEKQYFTIICGLIDLLVMSVSVLEQTIEKPQFIDAEGSKPRFRYSDPDELTFELMMCARVASALRAAAILLQNCHTTEVAVLFRTIDDFIANFMSVDEVLIKGAENVTASQRTFLERYFTDDPRSVEEKMANRKKVNYNEWRQKVQASEARLLGGENPHQIKQIVQVVDDVFSGFVHGDYASTMEMYGGSTLAQTQFNVSGIPVRFQEYRQHLAIYVHRALNIFSRLAHNLGHQEISEKLRQARINFEASPACPSE